jgi:hypothetical protein
MPGDLVARIRARPNDAPMPTEHLLDEAADEIERLRAALESCASWIDRWTSHVGNCAGGVKCTCGRTAILFDARAAQSRL